MEPLLGPLSVTRSNILHLRIIAENNLRRLPGIGIRGR